MGSILIIFEGVGFDTSAKRKRIGKTNVKLLDMILNTDNNMPIYGDAAILIAVLVWSVNFGDLGDSDFLSKDSCLEYKHCFVTIRNKRFNIC